VADPNGETGFPVIDMPAGADPTAAVRFLAAELVRSGRLPAAAAADVFTQVWARERLGTTAVGRALAIPHARSRLVEAPIGVIGRCAQPLDWPGGEPVGLVGLIVVPDGTPDQLIGALERIARQLRVTPRQGDTPVQP
jgi:PTS system nitrogen regulatory IIA component